MKGTPIIHSSAIVHPDAELGENVSIGAFSIVEKNVTIGAGTWIGPHVLVKANTRIGERNRIFQFSSIGDEPQHLAYKGEQTTLEIGNENIIRENCTISRGTPEGRGNTSIGNQNFLMAYVHVAHDCLIHNHTIFANCASLAGHVEVEDFAILGGFTLVHQYCKVGAHCIAGIGSVCLKDIPPYVVVAGNTAETHGINLKGLRRRDFSDSNIRNLKKAYKLVYRSSMDLRHALEIIEESIEGDSHVKHFVEFHRQSSRGVIR